MLDKYGIEISGTQEVISSLFSFIGVIIVSVFLACIVVFIVKSFYEGKRRAMLKAEAERLHEAKMKKLKNLKLENLEIKLTDNDINLLAAMSDNDATVQGTLRYVVREHLKGLDNA